MSLTFNLIMCLCLLPVLLIFYFLMYPKKWKSGKLILGLSMRKEYCEGETGEQVSALYLKRRNQAFKILIICIIISIILVLIHGFKLQTTLWLLFFYASLIGINVPFFLGNNEMKTIKRTMGLTSEEKVSYTDISMAGTVRTIKLSNVIIPNAVGFILTIAALLIDLKIIPVTSENAGSFISTGMLAIFWIMGMFISVIAFKMDGMKNEVISTDSIINSNYNRAKKKNLSDFCVRFLWVSALMMATSFCCLIFLYTELFTMIIIVVYLVSLMTGTFIYVFRNKKIEQRYAKEITVIQDEDDNWIGGFIYYNPGNRRIMVSKRIGVGAAVNAGHPVGKIIYGFIVLLFIFLAVSIIYVGMVEATPIKLSIKDNKLICHQLTDEYEINIDEIKNIEWGENVSELRMVKLSGFGIATLCKGNFTVNGETGCKVFLNPEDGNYIKVMTAETTYYVSAATSEETKEVFELLQSENRPHD